MGHADPVTQAIRDAVIARDRRSMRLAGRFSTPVCIAPLVDPACGACRGRTTLEHVKAELRMGVRAPSDLDHLVSLCEAHTENGMVGGSQWNTRRESRALVRAYLAAQNGSGRAEPSE